MGEFLAWQKGLLQLPGTSCPGGSGRQPFLQGHYPSSWPLSLPPISLLPFSSLCPVAGASQRELPSPPCSSSPGSHFICLLIHSRNRHTLKHSPVGPALTRPPLLQGTPAHAHSAGSEAASPIPASGFRKLHLDPEFTSAFCLRNGRIA